MTSKFIAWTVKTGDDSLFGNTAFWRACKRL